LKIIFLGRYNSSEILTGPEKVGKRIFERISKKSESVFIGYFFEGEKYNLISKLFGFEEIGKSIYRMGLIRLFLFLLNYKPEIIHIINFERFAAVSFLYRILKKVKIIYSVHGIIKYENEMRKNLSSTLKFKDLLIEKIYFSFSDLLLFLSKKSVETASKNFKVDKNRIKFIANGSDEIFYLQPSLYPNEELKVVFIGEINRKEKGFDFLLSALKSIDIKSEVFVISNYQPDIRLISEFHKIHFIKKMSSIELSSFLADKDLIVSTSSYEQFSISTLEAMSAGLVPIITKDAGLAEYINEENGFVINYGDELSLKQIIKGLASDKNKRKAIGLKARNIFTRLNWEAISDDYFEIYSNLK
jgi:glycosyltransferase involved in cell wall biosynthesis